mgnify:CR=1 FL=1
MFHLKSRTLQFYFTFKTIEMTEKINIKFQVLRHKLFQFNTLKKKVCLFIFKINKKR